MANPSVHVDAARKDRSLVSSAPAKRRVRIDMPLKYWLRQVESAIADAKRTRHGLPTDNAILAHWWLKDFRPSQADKDQWEISFACACTWLSRDVEVERRRVLQEIDEHWHRAWADHVRSNVYQRRASVLTCAGVITAVQRQYVLPLVADADYDDVAGVDHPDPPARMRAA